MASKVNTNGGAESSVNFKNVSKDTDIFLFLKQTLPKDGTIPYCDASLKCGGNTQKLPINFEGGCATLFVFTKDQKQVLWSGVVPLGTASPLLIDPDKKTITYQDMEIPMCPEACGLASYTIKGIATDPRFLIPGTIIVILAVVGLVYIFWRQRKIKSISKR